MSIPRIKGTGLGFKVEDNGIVRDFWAQATKVEMRSKAEHLTGWASTPQVFLDSRWQFEITAIQSTDPESFWTFLYENTNRSVPFSYAPHGNEEPSPEQPHFTGIVLIPPPPALGGEAGRFVEYLFDISLPIIQGPLRVIYPLGDPNEFYPN